MQPDSVRAVAGDPSSSATGDPQAHAQEFVGRAQDQAQAAAGQAQDRIREQIDQRSTQFGEQIHSQASDLRSVSDVLRDQGKDRPAQAVDRVAGYAEKAGGYLSTNDADSILADAESFGRERPGTVAAGALAAGFLASRFLKASSSRRYASRSRSQTAQTPIGPSTSTPGAVGSTIDPTAPAASEQTDVDRAETTIPSVGSPAAGA
jgi:hypothetical protein